MLSRRSALAPLVRLTRRTARFEVLLALALLLAALVGTSTACNATPTLPLPPPSVTVGSPGTDGLVRIQGLALERAYVSVLNPRTDHGVITRADARGAFEAQLAAQIGDVLEIWQDHDGDPGEHIDAPVPAPR